MFFKTMAAAVPLAAAVLMGATQIQQMAPVATGLRQAFVLAGECANQRALHAEAVADGTDTPGSATRPGGTDPCGTMAALAEADDGADDLGWVERLTSRLEALAATEPPISAGQVGQSVVQLAGDPGPLLQ